MEIGPILRDLALLTWKYNIYSSFQRITGADNNMAYAASRLTCLTNKIVLHHLSLTFLQKNTWNMLTLPS